MVIRCISPIDGSVFAEREALSHADAKAAVARAKAAQLEWAVRPLAERIALVQAGVAAVGAAGGGGAGGAWGSCWAGGRSCVILFGVRLSLRLGRFSGTNSGCCVPRLLSL